MSKTTPISGLPYPEGPDAPYVHLDMQAMATALDNKVTPSFANAAARTAAIPAPTAGQTVYMQDTKTHRWWDGAYWRLTQPQQLCRVGRNVQQNWGGDGFDRVYWDTVWFNRRGFYLLDVGGAIFKTPEEGLYRVSATVNMALTTAPGGITNVFIALTTTTGNTELSRGGQLYLSQIASSGYSLTLTAEQWLPVNYQMLVQVYLSASGAGKIMSSGASKNQCFWELVDTGPEYTT